MLAFEGEVLINRVESISNGGALMARCRRHGRDVEFEGSQDTQRPRRLGMGGSRGMIDPVPGGAAPCKSPSVSSAGWWDSPSLFVQCPPTWFNISSVPSSVMPGYQILMLLRRS
jgi:hypothetical protein